MKKPPEKLLQDFTQEVISRTGEKPTLVTAAVRGYYEQIRHTPNAGGRLIILFGELSKAYGGREVITEYILDQCCTIVMEQFPFLSLDEIEVAYRMWAAGDLETKGSAEMYGGSFNAGQVGKVLGAYAQHRKKIVAEFLRTKDAVEEARADRTREEHARQKYEDALGEWWLSEQSDWRELPLHRCETAIKRGLVTATDEEKAEILDDARQIAVMELNGRMEDARGRGIRGMGDLRNIEKLLKEDTPPTAQAIYSKLLVFRKHFLR